MLVDFPTSSRAVGAPQGETQFSDLHARHATRYAVAGPLAITREFKDSLNVLPSVNDTSPEIERMVRERYAAMEPVQRFLIGVSMFESARAMVLASFPPGGLSPLDLRRQLCERLYPELVGRALWKCAG